MHTFKHPMIALLAAASMPFAPMAVASPDHGTAREFAMMDTNKDGKISSEEHATGASAMFRKMDGNQDGSVTAEEMAMGHKAVTGKAAAKFDLSAHDKIKVVDGDGDGKLTAAEHVKASAAMFANMDADQDGFLSKQEMAAGHAAMLKKH